jgi:hypothetical protein
MSVIRRRAIAPMLVLVAALGGCGGSDDEDAAATAASTTAATPAAPVVRSIPATVEVVATGAVDVDYRADTDITVSVFRPGRPDLSLLTVGLAEERRSGDLAFRTAFDLAGLYEGPDRYTLPAIGSSTGASSISSAFLTAVGPNGADPRRFDRAVEACEIRVEEGERSGSIRCPRLEDASGAEVELRMSWSAKP